MERKKRYVDFGHGRFRVQNVVPGSRRDKEITAHNRKQKRRDRAENRARLKCLSLDMLEESGFQPISDEETLAERIASEEDERLREERIKKLDDAIRKLPPWQRRVIRLLFNSGDKKVKQSELAKRLGISEAAFSKAKREEIKNLKILVSGGTIRRYKTKKKKKATSS